MIYYYTVSIGTVAVVCELVHKEKKSETRTTASVLKQDPDTQKVEKV